MPLAKITEDTVKGLLINELQSLTLSLLAGTTANTDIALPGADEKRTTIASVLQYDPNGGGAGVGAFADLTPEAAVTSPGNLQLDTTDTTGTQLLVWHYLRAADKPLHEGA